MADESNGFAGIVAATIKTANAKHASRGRGGSPYIQLPTPRIRDRQNRGELIHPYG